MHGNLIFYRYIKIYFFLPSPFSVPSQEPQVPEIPLTDVFKTNGPVPQLLMAFIGTCVSLSVCRAPNQTQRMTVTES